MQIVIDALNARQVVASLRQDLLGLATAANTGANQTNQNLNRIGQSARQNSQRVKTAASDMESAMTRSLSRIGSAMVAAFGARELIQFGASAVRTNIEFKRMENVITGLTGSVSEAKEQLSFLSRETDRLGINFRQGVQAFIRFEAAAKGSTISQGGLRDIFVQTSEAARKFGLSTQEQERIFLAYEQMISKGVVSMEELRRQLGDALPGAFAIGARAMGLTTREFGKLVESGQLLSQEFVPKFAKQLSQDVTGAVDDLAVSFGRTQNAWDKFKASLGESLRQPAKAISDNITAALNQATVGQEYSAFMSNVKGNDPLTTIRALRKQFPDATKPQVTPNFVGGLNFGTSFDSFAEFQRMRSEQALAETAGPVSSGSYQPNFDLNLPDVPAVEPEDQKLMLKFEREMNQLTLERLEGADRIKESYKQQKQAVIDTGYSLDKEAQLITAIDRNMALALEDNAFDEMAKSAKRATDEAEDLARISNKLFKDSLSDAESRSAAIEKQFQDSLIALIQLEEYGANANGVTYEDLVAKRDEGLAGLNETRLRRGRRPRSESIGDVLGGWSTLEDRIRQGSADVSRSMESSFTDAFSSMILGTQSVGDAFKNMATSIVSDLVRIMVQQLIVRTVLQGFGVATGAVGSANASTDSAGVVRMRMLSDVRGAYVQHNGGVIGGYAEGPVRRFHDGGVNGDEAAVISRRGEVFFTPEQMQVLGSTISGAMPKESRRLNIVNVMDQSFIPNALVKNKHTIINIIGSESKTVRRSLA